MLKLLTLCFVLFSAMNAFANDRCDTLNAEINQQLARVEESNAIFQSGFEKVESSTLECKDVQPLLSLANEIVNQYSIIKNNATELENSCGIIVPIDDTQSEVSMRIHFINFYKIINCDKIDI